ncbi:hypothetical protein B4064_1367 [Caldibacillus thermoamylovorans]|nr:hypothetical protein B4065_2078 [Caldibacillus thermoamylovorans]KIO69153.1 hypothetical protein B4064_1367 [Caldibacillus thermoamylovorans]
MLLAVSFFACMHARRNWATLVKLEINNFLKLVDFCFQF